MSFNKGRAPRKIQLQQILIAQIKCATLADRLAYLQTNGHSAFLSLADFKTDAMSTTKAVGQAEILRQIVQVQLK